MGQIAARSGLSFNHGIIVIASVIDADYIIIGEIFVCLANIVMRRMESKKMIAWRKSFFFKTYAKKLKKNGGV